MFFVLFFSIAVDFLDSSYFCKNSHHMKGRAVIRKRHLEIMGYRVVQVRTLLRESQFNLFFYISYVRKTVSHGVVWTLFLDSSLWVELHGAFNTRFMEGLPPKEDIWIAFQYRYILYLKDGDRNVTFSTQGFSTLIRIMLLYIICSVFLDKHV